MSYCKTIAVALWRPDYEEIKERHTEVLSRATLIKNEKTPDETYTVIYWQDYEVTYPDTPMDALLKDIEDIRHSLVTISEDGVIDRQAVSSDDRGCDEEFDEILSWRADICVWDEVIK